MAAPIASANIALSQPVKRRLDAMRLGMIARLGRTVTMTEVVESLIDEHDKALETETA